MFARLFNHQADTAEKESYTLTSHRDHLIALIERMQESKTEAADRDDQQNAETQLDFAESMLAHINLMLNLSSRDISAKKQLGKKMNALPQAYFKGDEIPCITGPKSREFAQNIALHYRSFTKVQFSSVEIEASRLASMVMDIRSVPDQIKHHGELADRIERDVQAYDEKQASTYSCKG